MAKMNAAEQPSSRCPDCGFTMDADHDQRHARELRLRRLQREKDRLVTDWPQGED